MLPVFRYVPNRGIAASKVSQWVSPRRVVRSHQIRYQSTEPSAPKGPRMAHVEGDIAGNPNAVVLSKRIPENFLQDTLKPHLESQILESIHIYNPGELVKIVQAYSKIQDRANNLTKKLVDTVVYRMDNFEPHDLVDIIVPMYRIAPEEDELFQAIGERVEQLLEHFNALNLVAIIRIFNKRKTKNFHLLDKVLPILKKQLTIYDDAELCEMLLSIGTSGDGVKDMDILLVLLPEILTRYDGIPLLEHLNNVYALTKLKVIHTDYMTRVADGLKEPDVGPNLPLKYISRTAWIYRRCNKFELVRDTLLPLISQKKEFFNPGEFARLAQCIPLKDNAAMIEVQQYLRGKIEEMGRQDLIFYLLGNILLETLEEREADGTVLREILKIFREEEDNFKPEEIERITIALRTSPKYKHVLDLLPMSWYEQLKYFLDVNFQE